MDLGAGLGAEGSFGFSALNIRRGEDAVSWSVSQDKALSEDVVDVTVKLAANLESRDRNYELQLKLPKACVWHRRPSRAIILRLPKRLLPMKAA